MKLSLDRQLPRFRGAGKLKCFRRVAHVKVSRKPLYGMERTRLLGWAAPWGDPLGSVTIVAYEPNILYLMDVVVIRRRTKLSATRTKACGAHPKVQATNSCIADVCSSRN